MLPEFSQINLCGWALLWRRQRVFSVLSFLKEDTQTNEVGTTLLPLNAVSWNDVW